MELPDWNGVAKSCFQRFEGRDPVAIRLRSERDPNQFDAILLSQHTIFSRDPARPLTPCIILIARVIGDAVDSLEFYITLPGLFSRWCKSRFPK